MTDKTKSPDRFDYFNQPETLTSLASKYKVTVKTFHKWIRPIEDKVIVSHRKIFTPAELKIIIEFLGEYNLS